MKTSKIATYCILFCLFMALSCHPGVVLDWDNNTGEDLVFVIPGPSKESRHRLGPRRELRTGVRKDLRIEHKTGDWHYSLPEIPEHLRQRKNAMISVIKLRIEADGAIYAILPGNPESIHLICLPYEKENQRPGANWYL